MKRNRQHTLLGSKDSTRIPKRSGIQKQIILPNKLTTVTPLTASLSTKKKIALLSLKKSLRW